MSAVWWTVVASTSGCLGDNPDASEETGGSDDQVSNLSSAQYVLAWELGEAQRIDGELHLTTDLGFEVVLESAYLTSYAVQLAACDDDGLSGEEASEHAWWHNPLVRRAWAGHGEGWEPSAWTVPVVEDMVTAASTTLGTVGFAPAEQCRAHYLVGPAPEDALGLPSMPDMSDRSLHVQLRFRSGDAIDWTSHTVDSDLAWGVLQEHEALALGQTSHAKVVVVRRLDTLFDGLELHELSVEEAEGEDFAKAVLRNLGNDVRFEIER